MAKNVHFLIQMENDSHHKDVLYAYNLVNEGLIVPETLLGFLARLAQPLLPLFTIEFGTDVPVAVALSLVPTMAHNVGKNRETLLDLPSPDLLQALAVHPVHHDLDVVVLLASSKSRRIVCFRIKTGVPCPTLHFDPSQSCSQDEFDRLCVDSEMLSRHAPGFACFQVMFPDGLRSNREWDSLVAPTSVLNVVHQRYGGLPPRHLLGLAIKNTNLGGSYHRASNLAPFYLDAANATAIFTLFRDGPYRTSPHA
jgi:hypothetical protein